MAKIFLVRHGQTEDNLKNIFSGWRDVDLTPLGIQEAEKVAEKLKNTPLTKAYSSDLIRAKHTLAIILQFHPGIKPVEDPRIRERNYGSLTGTSKIELAEKDPDDFKKWHRSYSVPPPGGGESIKEVAKRVMPFFQEVLSSISPTDEVVIAAHGNSLRPIIQYLEHLTDEEIMQREYNPGTLFSYTV